MTRALFAQFSFANTVESHKSREHLKGQLMRSCIVTGSGDSLLDQYVFSFLIHSCDVNHSGTRPPSSCRLDAQTEKSRDLTCIYHKLKCTVLTQIKPQGYLYERTLPAAGVRALRAPRWTNQGRFPGRRSFSASLKWFSWCTISLPWEDAALLHTVSCCSLM